MAERSWDGQRAAYGWVLGLGGLLFLLNLWKPLTIDDTFYATFAQHIAAAPFDPYGFTLFWHQRPQPALTVLCPPLFPYWWALALHLFGGGPLLWKLWMLPFALLLVGALHSLLRRWATGIERPLLVLLVCSPIFLPSLNLMIDIPALALALTGLTIFLRAAERDSLPLALLAGVLVGLGGQTKYTALTMPAVFVLYAGIWRRWRVAVPAVAAAVAVFCAWEAFVVLTYGQSHIVYTSLHNELWPKNRLHFVQFALPIVIILGSAGMPLLLLTLAALGLRGAGIALAGGLGVAAFAFVVSGVAPSETVWLGANALSRYPLTAGHLVYGAFGAAFLAALAAAATRMRAAGSTRWRFDRDTTFLLLWLALEVAAAFLMMPFPAVRRVMGMAIVATLLCGRLAVHQVALPERRRLIGRVAAFSAALGALFALTDWYEAAAQRNAAQRAADRIAIAHSPGTVWYVGHWGFQFYAEQLGMQPVVPGQSELRAGDWLVVPDARVDQQLLVLRGAPLIAEPPIEIADALPTRTIIGFYATVAPLEALRGPRASVVVYQVLADFVPMPGL